MNDKITAWTASSQGALLTSETYPKKALGPFDVEVKVSHCGICHSDLHLLANDWGISTYPLVPGHEIVGHVTEMGASVAHLTRGQRVGIGWQSGSCGTCEQCVKGNENLCGALKATCVGNLGGFANFVQTDSRFAFPIPESLASENVAPLLCAGITVYAPFRAFNVKPTDRIGVIGIGGLGHLAIQFGKAWGCEVTAFSSSPDKEAEARKFGASKFVSSTNSKLMAETANSLDFIISTVNVDLEWANFVNCLRPDGKLCFVGIPPSDLKISVVSLLGGRRSICASPIGGRHLIREMLEFSARHRIVAQTEVVPMAAVNEALKRVGANTARYRMVLKAGL
jgi:alcohol/geraniol dehydrogenase (NADP+)